MKTIDILSIIILTYNEDLNIEKCLESALKLTKNIYIIDSYSTDKTIETCKKYNTNIYQHKFTNQANQINWALKNIKINTDWVLRLDADEYLTEKLIWEIKERLLGLNKNISGIFLKRRVYFMQKWIKHGGYYPTYLLRIWRNGHAVCESKLMDEHMKLTKGNSITFKNDFIDHNNKNLHWWINKHNNYATREAIELLNIKYTFFKRQEVKPSLLGTQEQRKRWLKEKIYFNIPLFARPWIYFLYRYFIKLGFLDGKQWLMWHFFQGL